MSNVKSAIRVKSNYGFSRIDIDFGNYSVYTCKILLGKDAGFPGYTQFENKNIKFVMLYVKKNGVEVLMHLLTYATMDYKEHMLMQKEIGKFLHKHAISKINDKYAYAYDPINEDIADMELTIPQPSHTLNWDDVDVTSLPELH